MKTIFFFILAADSCLGESKLTPAEYGHPLFPAKHLGLLFDKINPGVLLCLNIGRIKLFYKLFQALTKVTQITEIYFLHQQRGKDHLRLQIFIVN